MNIAILTSVRSTLENIDTHGKDNMLRMIACMNATEQLIQEASQPTPEQPAEPTRTEDPDDMSDKATEGVDS